ncbi:UDP-4-amino-4,6-dideoxy-N-acetyl-beta-L-altrosamine transaminase [Candidatus Woesearchaeota archaeon]|nr:UDP-4-amino-4,6-dideoxy-N-acetyl-beta-L-altrosamine transaminase [Candidatus Woesearchaeota archaeon]
MIPYGRQSISQDDIDAVNKVLFSDFLTTGPAVQQFEEEFAKKVGAKYAVAVSSGTAALHLACMVADLGPGDEVITTPITFAASANCARYVGASPVFADVDASGMIDPISVQEKTTTRTKAIIPVHYSGLYAPVKALRELFPNRIIIEDACHSLGLKSGEDLIGSCTYADMACFSFHPVKHITTGEGGMVTTNDKSYYTRLLALRSHGLVKEEGLGDGPWHQEIRELGYNYRLSDMQCALGLNQLKRLDEFNTRRKEIARKYDKEFKGLCDIPQEGKECVYHLYVVLCKDAVQRKALYMYLKKKGILAQVHYMPVYRHPVYKGYTPCEHADAFYARELSLPMFPGMTDGDVDLVIETVKEFFGAEQKCGLNDK